APDSFTADLRGRLRILRYDVGAAGDFAPVAQFAYLAERGQGLSDLVALDSSTLLALERGFVAGVGNTIRIYRVPLAGASDVTDRTSLNDPALAPLPKTLLVALASCPSGGARNPAQQPNPLLDNFEGLALGATLPDGRRTLLLVSDDNFGRDQV